MVRCSDHLQQSRNLTQIKGLCTGMPAAWIKLYQTLLYTIILNSYHLSGVIKVMLADYYSQSRKQCVIIKHNNTGIRMNIRVKVRVKIKVKVRVRII